MEVAAKGERDAAIAEVQQSLARFRTTFRDQVFKRGRVNLSDGFRDGHPSTAVNNKTIDAVRRVVETGRHLPFSHLVPAQVSQGELHKRAVYRSLSRVSFAHEDFHFLGIESKKEVYPSQLYSDRHVRNWAVIKKSDRLKMLSIISFTTPLEMRPPGRLHKKYEVRAYAATAEIAVKPSFTESYFLIL
ncbi:hypothetical protein EVAR_28937_1 [Eumeta japonica]|uniref:Uncharacterized protein n=1 Tax=Eumeta variegata TaxID=151549 RepID=A0A4C1VZM5_EUMVA|nr:hypothetical protein EVAR_28937_1 [Eumeta japonica]